MRTPLLLGFLEEPAPAELPDGVETIVCQGLSALVSDRFVPADLPEISAQLLRIQRLARLVPLRPAPVPKNLQQLAIRLEPTLIANLARVGQAVEFVVQTPVEMKSVGSPGDAKDYLRSALQAKQTMRKAGDAAFDAIRGAMATLDEKAIETKRSEPNVNQILSKHILIDVSRMSDVVNDWQGNRAVWASRGARLSGPWAPYSFVEIGG
ncbi:MAG: GvpL/GvpF family gas vesicle protein [Pseudomonadota bacterium]